MNATPPALSLENVSKRFGHVQAVEQLSLEIEPGQMAGFLGPNGAGKSTTLFMIPRLVRLGGGHIRIFGVDIERDFKTAIRSVGVMVEAPAFYEYLSGRKNLELSARILSIESPRREIDQILDRIGLSSRQHDRVGSYSMGMKQRLGVGRAMLGNPRLLILDEPTNGMDPEGTQEILSFLRDQVRATGLTIFISSHLMSEIEEFCDSVFVINHGRLVASGAVREILKPHRQILRITFRGQAPDIESLSRCEGISTAETIAQDTLEVTLAQRDSAWLNQYLLSRGFQVAALVPKQRSLKEFFLAITGEKNHA